MKGSKLVGGVSVALEKTPLVSARRKDQDGRGGLVAALKRRARSLVARARSTDLGMEGEECRRRHKRRDEDILGRQSGRVRASGNGEWRKERRQQLAWKRLLSWARLYARWRLSFVPWRGEEGGIPPEGFDAESVAMEAVMTVGQEQQETGKGWRRVHKPVARAIRRLVDRLKHRREPWCTSSEPDLKRVLVDTEEKSEEAVSPIERVADAGPRPGEELVEWERINEFKAYLGEDRKAKELVDCYCGNVTSRQEIARLTGLTWKEVKNARERLRAKWLGFRRWEEEREAA